jgi:photosystem II stability/assembly factor-like uncharacterized protein/5-hydroxyisourate hydrolase-like protein (transthyretin family)
MGVFMKQFLLFLCIAFLLPIVAESQVNWKRSNGPGTGSGVNTLFTDEVGHILAGVRGRGIFSSTDGGNNWRLKSMDYENVLAIAEKKGTDIMYCGVQSKGFYFSENNGSGFIQRSLLGETVNNILVAANGEVFAGTEKSGLHKSADNGISWAENYFAGENINYSYLADNGDVYINSEENGLHRTTDNGTTWEDLSFDALSVLAMNNGRVFAGKTGIHYTENNGETWTASGLKNYSVLSLLMMDNGHILAGTSKGIFRSSDLGQTWVDISSGLDIATDIYDFEISVDSYIYASSKYTSFVFKSNFQFNLKPLYIEVSHDFLRVGKRGSVYSYDIKVTTTGGEAVEGAVVDIQNLVGGNKTLQLITDANGEIEYKDSVSQSAQAGTYDIYFKATKDTYQKSEELTREYEVNVYNIEIVVNPSAKQEKDYGDTVVYEISMFLDKEPMADAKIEITDGLLNRDENLVADANGKATYTTYVPKGTPNSTYLVKFKGGNGVVGYTGILSKEIVINHIGLLVLTVLPEVKPTLDWGDSVVYEMLVIDEEDQPVQGVTISGVDGLKVSQIEVYTDTEGKVSYTAIVPDGLNDGTYLMRFVGIKDDNTQSEIVRRNITVFHIDTFVDEQEIESLIVYPNPAYHELQISMKLDQAEDMSLRMVSSNGDVVFAKKFSQVSGQQIIPVDISRVARGAYLLEVTLGCKKINRKVILK